jgi:5'-nucleotidase
MKILLTNDDGIHAPGLLALALALKDSHQVQIVAPENEQSAVGHAISLNNPLRVKEIHRNGAFFGWAINGTPADCVKIALTELLPQKPELVFSGINLGGNLGINVLYSGTVSAATEAAILGFRAVAFSLNTYNNPDFSVAASFAHQLLTRLPELPLAPDVCLNVNVPALPRDQIKGVIITRQDHYRLVEHFERRIDPRQNIYYWLAGINERQDLEPGTDYWAVRNAYISITPIHHDLTHYDSLENLKKLKW